MVTFFDLKHIAVKYFYKKPSGEDFIWLKNNFDKFGLVDQETAEKFICTLAYVYDCYYAESYAGDIELVDEFAKESTDLYMLIKDNERSCFEVLINAFDNVYEIDREFAKINIDVNLPHTDGLKFLSNRLKYFNINDGNSWPPPF